MFSAPLLSIIILLPLVSCLFVLISKDTELQNAKLSAICGSFLVLVTSFSIFSIFDFSQDTVQLIEEYTWVPGWAITYKVGVDRYSLFCILMIAIISFLSMIWIFKKTINKTKHFFISILLFESFSIGAFAAYDMFILLFFMEATMFPLFIMMHTSGKEGVKSAILQLFTYGTASAICVMIAILMIYNEKNTSDILKLYQSGFIKNTMCFWILLIGIAIKLPMFPLNYWLPKAHVESPTVCSVFLASVMLKFSSLIIIKILYHMFFDTLSHYSLFISIVCIGSALIACTNLFFQTDLKRFFAYFSILHMNIYFLIILSGCGIKRFIFSILYHSFISSVLFLITDVIKTVFKTRDIIELKNTKTQFMKAKRLMFLGILCLIGLPLTWGFITEIFSIYSANELSKYMGFTTGLILLISSSRAFYIYQSICGPWAVNSANSIDTFRVSNASKNIVLYTLFCIIFLVGIFSKSFF